MTSDTGDAVPDSATTFAALQTLLVSVEGVDGFLQDLAGLAINVATPVVSCGITVEYDGHPLTVSSSDAWARSLDESQYENHSGPCLEAMRTGEAVHVRDVSTESRWPDYTAIARSQGLAASLSLPLVVDGKSVGAVNFYSSRPDQTFDGEVRRHADMFVAQASTALLLALRQMRQNETNEQLEKALTSRLVIDQAIGIIMAQQRCTPERAFDYLRAHSQNNNRRLREVAAEVVNRISETGSA